MNEMSLHLPSVQTLALDLDAAEIRAWGIDGVQVPRIQWGYFNRQGELPVGPGHLPALETDGSVARLRQSARQVAWAREKGARLRLLIATPRGFGVMGRIRHGTIATEETGGCSLRIRSGTISLRSCTGAIDLRIETGTARVAGIAPGHRHEVEVSSGSAHLMAGGLSALVSAEVSRGSIQGPTLGTLKRIGSTGWRLAPLRKDPRSAIRCRVGSGAILFHGVEG